jgi:tetratricopeptide (TPR) repeat protein
VDSREDYHCALQKRAESTGQWFLEDRVISNWVTYSDDKSANPIVWVYGGPGFGKTILSATTIQHLLECTASPHERKLVYFYCNSSDSRKQSLLSILSALLAQVVHCLPSRPAQLYSRYMESRIYGRNRITIADEPLSLLKSLAAMMKGLFIVIDGIDECLNANEVALSLMSLCHESEGTRLLCFSRDIPGVRSAFGSVANVELTTSNLGEDISIYIKTQISRLPMDDPCLRAEIVARLSRDAGGMFLWARLMLESLQNVTTIEDTKLVLKEFPVGIEQVYISILGRLNALSSQHQDLARRTYLWTSVSTRLLSWEELQMILSFQQDIEAFSEDRKPFKNALLELCYPLIEYRDGHFRPIHASVKEFILGDRRSTGSKDGLLCDISEKEAHEEISGCCLVCLSIPEVAGNVNITSEAYPLARYATLNWCYHLLRSRQKPRLLDRALSFLSSASRRRTWMMRFLNADEAIFPLQTIINFQRNVYAWLNVDNADMDLSVKDILSAKDVLEDVQYSLFNMEQYRSQTISNSIGTCNFDMLMASRDLAREYTMSGQVKGGIEWFSNRVKEIQLQHGPKALQTAWILNILGLLHDQISNTGLAMEMQRQALAIQELQLPPNHLDTIWTINEIGRLYRHQELYDESEKSHLRALEMLRTVLPEDDLQIVWTLNTLARTYRKQKRIDEAIALHQKALVCQQQRLGLQHPHALWTMTDIGRCLRDQGNLFAALEIHQKALSHRQETLGDLHADTFWSFNDVGIILEELGDVRKAWRHHRFALEKQEALLGTCHKHTVWSRCVVKRLEECYGMK